MSVPEVTSAMLSYIYDNLEISAGCYHLSKIYRARSALQFLVRKTGEIDLRIKLVTKAGSHRSCLREALRLVSEFSAIYACNRADLRIMVGEAFQFLVDKFGWSLPINSLKPIMMKGKANFVLSRPF